MTIPIQKTNLKPINFGGAFTRYESNNVIYYGEGDYRVLTYDTYKRKTYQTNQTDQVFLITIKYQYRPDLLSYDKYGTVNLWWKILEYNNIKDIWDFKSGKTIVLPENIYFN